MAIRAGHSIQGYCRVAYIRQHDCRQEDTVSMPAAIMNLEPACRAAALHHLRSRAMNLPGKLPRFCRGIHLHNACHSITAMCAYDSGFIWVVSWSLPATVLNIMTHDYGCVSHGQVSSPSWPC